MTADLAGFLIPRSWIRALQDVPAEALTILAVWPDGPAIELEDMDIHISVDELMTAVLPARMLATMFARCGGRPRKAGKAAVG